MIRRVALALALAATCAAAAQPVGAQMLKPGTWPARDQSFYERWFGNQLRVMREKPLWRGGDPAMRLLVLPSFGAAVAIRIDRRGEAAVETITRLTGRGGYDAGEVAARRTVRLSGDQLRRLDAAIDQADLWRRGVEPSRDERLGICTDGTQYVFERGAGDEYALVSRHQCAADGAVAAVVRSWLAIAPEIGGEAYLPPGIAGG